jgi:hypothetical protein
MTKAKAHPSPFERFKRTVKDLLSVSRKELQAEMDKYKRQKIKRKR